MTSVVERQALLWLVLVRARASSARGRATLAMLGRRLPRRHQEVLNSLRMAGSAPVSADTGSTRSDGSALGTRTRAHAHAHTRTHTRMQTHTHVNKNLQDSTLFQSYGPHCPIIQCAKDLDRRRS